MSGYERLPEIRKRILELRSQSFPVSAIKRKLAEEGFRAFKGTGKISEGSIKKIINGEPIFSTPTGSETEQIAKIRATKVNSLFEEDRNTRTAFSERTKFRAVKMIATSDEGTDAEKLEIIRSILDR